MKISTENKVFYFLPRNWMFLFATDICQIPFLTFISVVLAISFSLSVSVPHIESEVGRFVNKESNYNK